MDQSNCSNDIEFALHNLPKGRTNLSSTVVNKLTWEVDEKGSFQVDSYKTIEQTDTLAELDFDSRNPSVVNLLNISQEKESQEEAERIKKTTKNQNKTQNDTAVRNVKPRTE